MSVSSSYSQQAIPCKDVPVSGSLIKSMLEKLACFIPSAFLGLQEKYGYEKSIGLSLYGDYLGVAKIRQNVGKADSADQLQSAIQEDPEASEVGHAVPLGDLQFYHLNHGENQGSEGASHKTKIARLLRANGCESAPCVWVLPHSHYQIMLMDKPAVSDEEMADALKWKVKDRLDGSVDDYLISYFPLPKDASRGVEKLFVVVVPRHSIETLVFACQQNQLQIKKITIADLAVRNLIPDMENLLRGCALLMPVNGKGVLNFYRGDNLYFSRDFELVFDIDGNIDSDAMALEIQRSMDYYERQMGQPSPEKIYCCLPGKQTSVISDVQKSFRVDFELLDTACADNAIPTDDISDASDALLLAMNTQAAFLESCYVLSPGVKP